MDKDSRHHDVSGNALMGDDAGAKVKRSGSASIMATCQHDRMISVAALQKMGQNITTAWYCAAHKDPKKHLADKFSLIPKVFPREDWPAQTGARNFSPFAARLPRLLLRRKNGRSHKANIENNMSAHIRAGTNIFQIQDRRRKARKFAV